MKVIVYLLFLLSPTPPHFAKPHFGFKGDTLEVAIETKNPSSMCKLVYGKVKDPLDYVFENYIISRRTSNIHIFKITDIEPERIYIFKATFFDTITKLIYATQDYFFRAKAKGDTLFIGLVVEVGPYLSLIDEEDLGIAFYTNYPAKAELYLNENLYQVDTIASIRHEFIVIGLKSGNYAYKIKIFNDFDTTFSFTYHFTLNPTSKIKIGIFGDTRGNPNSVTPSFFVDGVDEEICRRIMKSMYVENVQMVFVTGDLITGRMQDIDYAEEEYKSFIKACWPYISFIPVLPIPGNHDMIAPCIEDSEKRYDPPSPGSAEDLWAKIFVLPQNGPEAFYPLPPYKENVYYLKFKDFVFYALNSDYNYVLNKRGPNPSVRLPDSTQWIWLLKVREENRDARYHILLFHEPLVGLGIYGRGERDNRVDSFANFIQNLGFKFYIAGHDHMYARGKIFNGLLQIVSAGGGAPLYDLKMDLKNSDIEIQKYFKTFHYLILEPQKKRKIRLIAKSLNGQILDELLLP